MNCDSARQFLQAYLDGELDAANALTLEEHLKTCDSCSKIRTNLEALSSVIVAQAPRYRAPDALRARVQSDLRRSPRRNVFDWKWAAIAASLLVAALALWQLQVRPRQQRETLIASEIVSSHVRSLMAGHLVDEPSSDRHTVKPWFAGKLNFSPTVKDLSAQGFPVAGGRLDYIGNQPVAAIVYRRRQHVINLFVWPASGVPPMPDRSPTANGFNIVSWISEGLRYTAVSDLNKPELESFSRIWMEVKTD